MNPSSPHPAARSLALWLFSCCGLVFIMVIVGAITRLTESGLSITQWHPVTGTIPPLNEAQWEQAFDLYRQSPEFQKKNFWMSLEDFKKIFFWEWAHRLLGRLIGMAYALPFIWFWIRGSIPSGFQSKLFGVFVLGGLQGAMGWYMVKSGLVDIPAVSHYRLAAHLMLAFLIFTAMLWLGLSLIEKQKQRGDKKLFLHGIFVLLILTLTIIWGAFTAGLDAGLIYNDSFPKMGGSWLPPDIWNLSPLWINFLENHGGVQFMHRWLAMFSVAMVAGLWLHGIIRKRSFPALHALMLMTLLQLGLGITALLSQVWLPLAVTHQAGALMTLALLIISLHRLRA